MHEQELQKNSRYEYLVETFVDNNSGGIDVDSINRFCQNMHQMGGELSLYLQTR